jgi:hypothetical protein
MRRDTNIAMESCVLKVVVCQYHERAEGARWQDPLQSTEPQMCLCVVTGHEKAGVGGWSVGNASANGGKVPSKQG